MKVSEIGLHFNVSDHNTGQAQYFRTRAGAHIRYWAKENGYDLYADGLKIYTTIDSKMQACAEKALKNHMKELQEIFIDHLEGDAPWIYHDGNELEDYIENSIKSTPYYISLRERFDEDSDSLQFFLNKPKKMTVFSWEGEIDTTFSMLD